MIQYLKLFLLFFKIGLFGFGGGYTMLPMIYQDIQAFGLMSSHEFSNLVALSQMTPGPIAVNAATYVGYRSAGFWGAVFATVGVSLPSLAIVLIIAAAMVKFKSNPAVQSVLSGIRPATVGMIAAAVIFFSKTSIFNEHFFSAAALADPLRFINLPAMAVFGLTLICAGYFKIGPILLTVLAGFIGAFIF